MAILDPNEEILIVTWLNDASLDQVGMDLLYPLLIGAIERFLTLRLDLRLDLGLDLRLDLGLDLGLSVVLFRRRHTYVNSVGNAQLFQSV